LGGVGRWGDWGAHAPAVAGDIGRVVRGLGWGRFGGLGAWEEWPGRVLAVFKRPPPMGHNPTPPERPAIRPPSNQADGGARSPPIQNSTPAKKPRPHLQVEVDELADAPPPPQLPHRRDKPFWGVEGVCVFGGSRVCMCVWGVLGLGGWGVGAGGLGCWGWGFGARDGARVARGARPAATSTEVVRSQTDAPE
jgi:hypothetical protein